MPRGESVLGTAWAEAPPPRVAPPPSAVPFHRAGFSRYALGAGDVPVLASTGSPGVSARLLLVPRGGGSSEGAAPLLRSPKAGGPRVLPTPLLGPCGSLGLWERQRGGCPWWCLGAGAGGAGSGSAQCR